MVRQKQERIWLVGRFFSLVKKYRMTIHRPQTKFFTSEKNRIGFPAFQKGFPSQWWINKTRSLAQLSLFPLSRGFFLKLFKSCGYSCIGGIHRRPRKRKHTLQNKALQNVALLNDRPQFHLPRLFAYLSPWRRYLRELLMLFMAVNSACLSTAFINRQPW